MYLHAQTRPPVAACLSLHFALPLSIYCTNKILRRVCARYMRHRLPALQQVASAMARTAWLWYLHAWPCVSPSWCSVTPARPVTPSLAPPSPFPGVEGTLARASRRVLSLPRIARRTEKGWGDCERYSRRGRLCCQSTSNGFTK